MKIIIKKLCKICGQEFETTRNRRETCGDICRDENKNRYQTKYEYINRMDTRSGVCTICNFPYKKRKIIYCYEGNEVEAWLCPNHLILYRLGDKETEEKLRSTNKVF